MPLLLPMKSLLPHILTTILIACASSSGHAGEALNKALKGIPSGAKVAYAVQDCATGQWLVQRNADSPLRLASVTKVYTAAAALWALGPDFRFTTLLAASKNDDLLVWGGGNPCLDEHHSDGEPNRFIASWAQQLSAQGKKQFTGDLIIIEPKNWGSEQRPPTWPMTIESNNIGKHYTAPTSFFAFNNNCIDVQAEPSNGARALVRSRPAAGPHLTVINKTTNGSPTKFLVHRSLTDNTCTVSGKIGKKTAWFPVAIHENPTELHADHLYQQLTAAGVTIAGKPVIQSDFTPLLDAKAMVKQQADLWSALRILLQRSNNFYGEQIHRTYASFNLKPDGEQAGSSEIGNQVRQRMLEERGLGNNVALLDGSGLSYENRASANAVCALLTSLDGEPWAEAFRAALKQSTVQGRSVDAKTGTISKCRTLAGYWTNKKGQRRAFCILLDIGSSKSINWARQRRDTILAALIKEIQ